MVQRRMGTVVNGKLTKHVALTLRTWRRLNKHRLKKEIGTGRESFETTLSRLLDYVDEMEAEEIDNEE